MVFRKSENYNAPKALPNFLLFRFYLLVFMFDLKNFASAISQIVEEKGIPEEKVVETIELALAAAYKRDYASRGENIKVSFDPKNGHMEVFKVMLVVNEDMLKPEETEDNEASQETAPPLKIEIESKKKTSKKSAVKDNKEPKVNKIKEEKPSEEDTRIRFNQARHIMVKDAKKIRKGIKAGEELFTPLEVHENFGRIAAQTAKQVIIQRIREAEREAVFGEFKDKEGELISGIVQRVEGRTVYVDIGKTFGVLFPQEQIPGEYYRIGSRIRFYVVEVNSGPKGPQVILSRSHPKMISKLFELEVPEVASGTVVLKSVAREAGSRTKIAVTSTQEGIDPIGSCVGHRGTRITTVIGEIGGEKIDVIEWSEDSQRYITNALSPAKATSVELGQKNIAVATVPDDQLSLAIGKEGQNVRLAAKLTGWKIDIRGESGEVTMPSEPQETTDNSEGESEAQESNNKVVTDKAEE
ncbi:MAG: hypothetical protein A3A80_02495 [Candidatus Terrybacteria bacterium RIFCSPLOWO2_01_FULL_44_24]|uniref:Transcription termination/antitermination protein NusA n=1 Tax=Candidatus Terrybacteria bacterium RIFCSPHIGHO2_01_FULL_43_35 TaxID=1802361 RepID=A0A1G2PEE4_9BACT|nr:MAG: hypothetical protein A2828_02290 [Candidatus Terrybacteria bacterium RIFCSPHIGHO2_01_FULL_43_35]OHA50304.1 MAG: hypothetical protein A3B75_00705 [Candidatus Terrybacteria bacterium RIFCSPHIGHO2_02_FULL_43_14]OHA50943.1 MAG: hypothetical protein A3A80_02495 [Candidatus Terrybacteria bacterium RIFCSPLOWO2_01_FULL_44_24]